MSRYSGPGIGSTKVREQKRHEAEERNAATPRDRTKQWRRDRAKVRAALDEAARGKR